MKIYARDVVIFNSDCTCSDADAGLAIKAEDDNILSLELMVGVHVFRYRKAG
jgi:hypothetical protein